MTRVISTINPATEEVINTYEVMTKEQICEKTKLSKPILSGKQMYRKELIIFTILLTNLERTRKRLQEE